MEIGERPVCPRVRPRFPPAFGAELLVFEARSGSTLLVRVEDVVLRLHWRMARVSAV